MGHAVESADGVPAEWAGAIAAILRGAARRVMVLGPPDAGKSSFCRALLAADGRGVRLIDSDVGQKIVGPPAAVTVADGHAPDVLVDLAFVGATDPVSGFARLIRGMGDLAARASPDPVVVNTSGYLAGPGRRLKREKIAAVGGDLLVAIGQGSALEAVLSDHPSLPAIRLPTPSGARRKSRAARRAARRAPDLFRERRGVADERGRHRADR